MRLPPAHDERPSDDPAERVFDAIISLAERLDLPAEDVAVELAKMLQRAVIVEDLMDQFDVRRQPRPP